MSWKRHGGDPFYVFVPTRSKLTEGNKFILTVKRSKSFDEAWKGIISLNKNGARCD
jgi:hypothetical protein